MGDALVTFSTERSLAGRTSAKAERTASGDEWQVWLYPAEAGWKGFPFLRTTADGWDIWFLGELYNLAGRDVEVVLHETFARGNQCALNGHFLILAWHKASKRWHLWTNRFGTIHAYYATDGRRAAIGTYSPAVAAAASTAEIDWVGLTGFFGFGFFPGDRTFHRDVRILRPASHYVFDATGCLESVHRYWRWRHEPDREQSYDDVVDAFGQIMSEVMADHMREGRIALPISGGLDSRSTVAAVPAGDHSEAIATHFWPYSYGYRDDSVETRIAAKIAEARGLPLQRFTIRPYLFDKLEHVISLLEGFQDITQARQAFVSDVLGREADYVIAAHWGDVWLDDMGFLGASEGVDSNRLPMQTVEKMKKRGSRWLLEHLVASRINGNSERVLRDIIDDELNRVGGIQDPDFRLKAYKTDQWSFRWTLASLRMFQSAAFPRLPFYDTRMADFFCTLPSDYVRGRRLQIDYLKRFAPELARVKWQAYDTNLYRYQHFDTWHVPKRAVKKAWRLLRRERVVHRNWEIQFLNDEGRRHLGDWLVRPGLKLHAFVSPATVRTLLDQFYTRPSAANGYTVSMLLTFSAWLERYG